MGASTVRRQSLSSSEAAAALGVSERTLRRYIVSGHIRCNRLPGGHYRIPAEAIDEFWAAQEYVVKRRRRAPDRAPGRRQRERRTASTRRPPLGREQPEEYDLSPSHLAEIRARFAANRKP